MVIPKQLTPKGRHRGKGGSPISSSLPRTETQKQKQQEQKEKPKADCKLAQKKIEQKSI